MKRGNSFSETDKNVKRGNVKKCIEDWTEFITSIALKENTSGLRERKHPLFQIQQTQVEIVVFLKLQAGSDS